MKKREKLKVSVHTINQIDNINLSTCNKPINLSTLGNLDLNNTSFPVPLNMSTYCAGNYCVTCEDIWVGPPTNRWTRHCYHWTKDGSIATTMEGHWL